MMSPHICQSDLKRLWYDPNLKATNIQSEIERSTKCKPRKIENQFKKTEIFLD